MTNHDKMVEIDKHMCLSNRQWIYLAFNTKALDRVFLLRDNPMLVKEFIKKLDNKNSIL